MFQPVVERKCSNAIGRISPRFKIYSYVCETRLCFSASSKILLAEFYLNELRQMDSLDSEHTVSCLTVILRFLTMSPKFSNMLWTVQGFSLRLQLFMHSLFLSVLCYWCLAYGNSISRNDINSLQRLQNSAIRYCQNAVHGSAMQTCCMIQQALILKDLQYLSEKLLYREEVSKRIFLQNRNLHVSKVKGEIRRNCFSYFGKFFNDVPLQVGAAGAAENDTSSPDDEKALRQLEWEDDTQIVIRTKQDKASLRQYPRSDNLSLPTQPVCLSSVLSDLVQTLFPSLLTSIGGSALGVECHHIMPKCSEDVRVLLELEKPQHSKVNA
ncbi:hypothetical protein J6590_044823 [Homalodisca vitripennis]|nr:hypothetical protein J6590_044823 [Homalodisca vitripennis]